MIKQKLQQVLSLCNINALKQRFFEQIAKAKDFIKDIQLKLNDLSKTNYDLGIYHFYAGNINDCIFRFKLLKKFTKHCPQDVSFFLGRSYMQKNNIDRAVLCLEEYINSTDETFCEEAQYCMNVIKTKFKKIDLIPDTIIKQHINSYYKTDKGLLAQINAEKKSVTQTLQDIENLLKNLDKTFDYNILDLGADFGIIPRNLAEKKLTKNIFGITTSEKALEYCRELKVNALPVYTKLKKEKSLESISNKTEKNDVFDLIICNDYLLFHRDTSPLFKKLKDISHNNSVILLKFLTQNNVESKFEPQLESFSFQERYIEDQCQKNNFLVVKKSSNPVASKNSIGLSLAIFLIKHSNDA